MFSNGSNGVTRNAVLVAIGVVVIVAVVGVVLAPALAVNILGFCTMIAVSLFAVLKVDGTGQVVSEKVTEVSKQLHETDTLSKQIASVTEEQLVKLQKTGQDTHGLVNSAMGVQLRLYADLTDRVARQHGMPEDIKAAEDARIALEAHEKQQAIVDARKAPKASPPL